jgi:hypothetical protein
MAKLVEGKTYIFQVDGTISLTGDKSFYKLIDPNGVNHLLDHTIYRNYGFGLDDKIKCRVDKINCTGRIFLEPEHPFYKLGENYELKYDHSESIVNAMGTPELIAVFTDSKGQFPKIPQDDLAGPPKAGKTYKFNISRIKQGQIFISIPGSANDYSGMLENNIYTFILSRLKTYTDKYEYFVFVDDAGKEFLLRTKFFKKYNFNIGDTINCMYRRINEEDFLEPVHPLYKVGKTYIFDIIGNTEINQYPEGKEKAYILKNDFGKDILLPENQIRQIKNNKVECKVIDIIKSRVYLT